jgi:hypothetical protein
MAQSAHLSQVHAHPKVTTEAPPPTFSNTPFRGVGTEPNFYTRTRPVSDLIWPDPDLICARI